MKTERYIKNDDFIKAKKSLGQNFCRDSRIPDEILTRLAPGAGYQVWEIGPGKGALTQRLLETGANLHLFEIDERMRSILETYCSKDSITWGDFLELEDTELPAVTLPLLVCGNLPYYCGTPIIKRFLENGPHVEKMVFLLQEEVAKKAAATYKDRDYGYLSVHTSFFARATTGNTYPPSSFVPEPKINSTILQLEPLSISEQEKNRRLKALKQISMIFSQRRKMVLPILKKRDKNTDWTEKFKNLGIDEKARPENISSDQLLELFGS